MSTPPSEDEGLPAIPKLRRVHIKAGQLMGTFILRKGPQQHQHDLLSEYQKAMASLTWDRRPSLKEKPAGFQLHGPLEAFSNLEQTERAAVDFTCRYGGLVCHPSSRRLASRPRRRGERHVGGVTSKTGNDVVDREQWSMRLEEFWQEQRRFRTLSRLGVAVATHPDQVSDVLREAVDTWPDLCACLGQTSTADALDRISGELGETDAERIRDQALRRIEEAGAGSEHMQRALLKQAGQEVAAILTKQSPSETVTFDHLTGFLRRPKFKDLLQVLYFLLAQTLPAYRFCRNCGRLYYKYRADKNTCSTRCAGLLAKREWATKNRKEKAEANARVKRRRPRSKAR